MTLKKLIAAMEKDSAKMLRLSRKCLMNKQHGATAYFLGQHHGLSYWIKKLKKIK